MLRTSTFGALSGPNEAGGRGAEADYSAGRTKLQVMGGQKVFRGQMERFPFVRARARMIVGRVKR